LQTGLDTKTVITHGTVNFTDGIPFVTTQEILIHDQVGNLLVNESRICNAPNSFDLLSSTLNKYDLLGHLIESKKDGRIIYSAVYNGSHKTQDTDEFGITKLYSYYSTFDSNDMPGSVTRNPVIADGILSEIPKHEIVSLYDNFNRIISETQSAGEDENSSTQERKFEYDSLGRIKRDYTTYFFPSNGTSTYVIDIGDKYSYDAALRSTTKADLRGLTTITTNYRDGQTKLVNGTAALKQAYDYGVSVDGNQWQKVSIGADTDPIWTQTTYDMAGRTIEVKQPSGPAGVGTAGAAQFIRRAMTYNAESHIASESIDGLGVRNYTYVYQSSPPGFFTTETLDTGNVDDGQRTSSTRMYYAKEGTRWFRILITTKAGIATTTTKEQVGGFAANEMARSVFIDAAGNSSTTLTIINGQKVITATTRSDVTNVAESISRAGLVQSIKEFNGANPAIITYDGYGRTVSLADPRTGLITTWEYETAFQNVSKITRGTDVTEFTYSLDVDQNLEPTKYLGRLISKTINGVITNYDYTDRGEQRRQWGTGTYPIQWDYDTNGRLITMRTYRDEVDAANWTRGSATTAGGSLTSWQYHANTNLIYRKLDNSNNDTIYEYYPDGQVRRRRWARATNGVIASYTYNLAGEPKTIDYSDTTPDVSMKYNSLGQIREVIDAGGVRTLTNDNLGRPLTESLGTSGLLANTSLSWTWTGPDRLAQMTAKFGANTVVQQNHTYEPTTGRLDKISDGALEADYDYLPNSNWVDTLTIKQNAVLAVMHKRVPDVQDRLQSVTASRGAAIVESHAWTYDAKGRRIKDTLKDNRYWAYSAYLQRIPL
jgi:hypothetical protein